VSYISVQNNQIYLGWLMITRKFWSSVFYRPIFLCDAEPTLYNCWEICIVKLTLTLHWTACRRRCGHPHRCSCSGVVSRLSISGACWALGTPCDYFQSVMWPSSLWLYVMLSIVCLLLSLSLLLLLDLPHAVEAHWAAQFLQCKWSVFRSIT